MSHDDEPLIEKETVSTALVDGRNLLGAAVGKFSMKLAIKVNHNLFLKFR